MRTNESLTGMGKGDSLILVGEGGVSNVHSEHIPTVCFELTPV